MSKRYDRESLVSSNLELYTKGVGRNREYYLPEPNRWVKNFSAKNLVGTTILNQRHWYNRYILGIDDPEYSPECCLDGCESRVGGFKGTQYGYPIYCSCKCNAKAHADLLVTSSHTPEVESKRSASLLATLNTPEYKLGQSIRSSNMWKDPEFRKKNLPKIPRNHKNISKISKEAFDMVNELFRISGWGECIYGTKELRIETGVNLNDNKICRYVDFYNPLMNVVIKFQGDYWHPRCPEKYGLDRVRDSISNDLTKELMIKKSLADDIFYIFEHEFRENKFECISRLYNQISMTLEQ